MQEKLEKTIPEDELQKYIVGYEMIRCDGRGMKRNAENVVPAKILHRQKAVQKETVLLEVISFREAELYVPMIMC